MTVDILPEKARPGSQFEEGTSSAIALTMPPDKSIMHRLLIIGAMTQTAFTIPIPSLQAISHDIVATVLALESLGVPVDLFYNRIELQGVGMRGFKQPTHLINCANSGTTARLLMGLLAGQEFTATLTGDDSLSQRPMGRLARVLNELGAKIATTESGTLPATIEGGKLKSAGILLPVLSAQMKTALLLSGMQAAGTTHVNQPGTTRDHTERMLEAFGYPIEEDDNGVAVTGLGQFTLPDEVKYLVPGDISSAAFIILAAILLRRNVRVDKLLLNPTRTRFLEILTVMGVELEEFDITEEFGEERGTLVVYGERVRTLEPFQISGDDVAMLIDELPVLSVLASFASGESTISGAEELRVKESDRIHLVALQLTAFGVSVEEHADGLTIRGEQQRLLRPAPIEHGGDHRLAMAFAVAALMADGKVHLDHAEVVSVSYPEFFDHLGKVAGADRVKVYRESATSG